jgi:effector-binding domain-containing protein
VSYVVETRHFVAQPSAVVVYESEAHEIGAGIGAAYGEIDAYLRRSGLEHNQTTTYLRVRPRGDLREVEAGFTVTNPIVGEGRVKPGTLPECEAVVVLHAGPYDQLPRAYDAIREWLAAAHFDSADYPWETYLTDPRSGPPETWRTEVVWPFRRGNQD